MNGKSYEDDTKIVEGCIDRDLSAWAGLITKYSSLIYNSIELRLRKYNLNLPRQDIEDIHQHILKLLWEERKLEGVANRKDISYWLAIVSGNMAIEYTRRLRASQPSKPILSIFEKIGEGELSDIIHSARLAPSDELARDEISRSVDSAIESLNDKEKVIIKLNIFHDKKYYEIADMLNMPKGTVSSYLKRAKERLRRKLKYLQ